MRKDSSISLLATEVTKRAEEFREAIKQHEMEYIASDCWKPHEHIFPKEKHIQTKAETFTVEGYNSLFIHQTGENCEFFLQKTVI